MTQKAIYIEWDLFSACAIVGSSGSGKTSTLRLILAELALDGIGLVICDPHGNLNRDNLASVVEVPLKNAIIRPIAKSKDEIIKAIRYVKNIMTDRYERGATEEQRIVLVIDEVVSFLIDCTPEETQEIASFFLKIANEARKVGIRIFLSSQNWKSDYIGSKSVRNSINAVIFHRVSGEEVKLFYQSAPAVLQRQISGLKQGTAIIRAAQHDFVKVVVPYVSIDDLSAIKDIVPVVAPIQTITNNNSTMLGNNAETMLSELLSNTPEKDDSRGIVRATTVNDTVKNIRRSIILGHTKTQTILYVFGIKAGTNKKYKAASKMYDRVKENYGL